MPDDAELSDPEHGDNTYEPQLEMTDREIVLAHKGTLPKEKREALDDSIAEAAASKNDPHQHLATHDDSEEAELAAIARRKKKNSTNVYDLEVRKLEQAISKIKPKTKRESTSFVSPSR